MPKSWKKYLQLWAHKKCDADANIFQYRPPPELIRFAHTYKIIDVKKRISQEKLLQKHIRILPGPMNRSWA